MVDKKFPYLSKRNDFKELNTVYYIYTYYKGISDLPELPDTALARRIVKAFINDDFNICIVHGNLRIGKSLYSKILSR